MVTLIYMSQSALVSTHQNWFVARQLRVVSSRTALGHSHSFRASLLRLRVSPPRIVGGVSGARLREQGLDATLSEGVMMAVVGGGGDGGCVKRLLRRTSRGGWTSVFREQRMCWPGSEFVWLGGKSVFRREEQGSSAKILEELRVEELDDEQEGSSTSQISLRILRPLSLRYKQELSDAFGTWGVRDLNFSCNSWIVKAGFMSSTDGKLRKTRTGRTSVFPAVVLGT